MNETFHIGMECNLLRMGMLRFSTRQQFKTLVSLLRPEAFEAADLHVNRVSVLIDTEIRFAGSGGQLRHLSDVARGGRSPDRRAE